MRHARRRPPKANSPPKTASATFAGSGTTLISNPQLTSVLWPPALKSARNSNDVPFGFTPFSAVNAVVLPSGVKTGATVKSNLIFAIVVLSQSGVAFQPEAVFKLKLPAVVDDQFTVSAKAFPPLKSTSSVKPASQREEEHLVCMSLAMGLAHGGKERSKAIVFKRNWARCYGLLVLRT